MRKAIGDSLSMSRHQFTVSASVFDRHDGVDQAPVERRGGVVLAAEQPDFLGALHADGARHQPGAEAGVEAADARAGLAEAGVVGSDGKVADQVQDMAAADGEAGDHRHHRLGQAANLHLQVEDVEVRVPPSSI
jgi:hypothetical protein